MAPPPNMIYGHHVGVKSPNRVGFKTAESWAPLPKTPPRSGLYCGHVGRTSRLPLRGQTQAPEKRLAAPTRTRIGGRTRKKPCSPVSAPNLHVLEIGGKSAIPPDFP